MIASSAALFAVLATLAAGHQFTVLPNAVTRDQAIAACANNGQQLAAITGATIEQVSICSPLELPVGSPAGTVAPTVVLVSIGRNYHCCCLLRWSSSPHLPRWSPPRSSLPPALPAPAPAAPVNPSPPALAILIQLLRFLQLLKLILRQAPESSSWSEPSCDSSSSSFSCSDSLSSDICSSSFTSSSSSSSSSSGKCDPCCAGVRGDLSSSFGAGACLAKVTQRFTVFDVFGPNACDKVLATLAWLSVLTLSSSVLMVWTCAQSLLMVNPSTDPRHYGTEYVVSRAWALNQPIYALLQRCRLRCQLLYNCYGEYRAIFISKFWGELTFVDNRHGMSAMNAARINPALASPSATTNLPVPTTFPSSRSELIYVPSLVWTLFNLSTACFFKVFFLLISSNLQHSIHCNVLVIILLFPPFSFPINSTIIEYKILLFIFTGVLVCVLCNVYYYCDWQS